MRHLVLLLLSLAAVVADERDSLSPESVTKLLGHGEYEIRERAEADLLKLGEAALPALDRARRSEDPEISNRAEGVWRTLEIRRRVRGIESADVRERAEKLAKGRPGRTILLIPLLCYRDGAFHPMVGHVLQISLWPEGARGVSNPDEWCAKCEPTDGSGIALLSVPSASSSIMGWSVGPVDSTKASGIAGMHMRLPRSRRVGAEPLLTLEPLALVPPMEWAPPDKRSALSLKEDPEIRWKPYPGVKEVEVFLGHLKDGTVMGMGSARLPSDKGVPLSRILSGRFKAGDRITLQIKGYDAEGSEVSGNMSFREILLAD